MLGRAEAIYSLAAEQLQDDNIQIDSTNIIKIKKDPIGISVIISPWNYPLLCAVGAMIPSILGGSPVLLKHSPRTPITGNHFEEAFKSTGAPNVVQHIFLKNENVHNLYKINNVGFVGFTGSVDSGYTVLDNIAKSRRFINTNFELGGN